jgi:hypothetical protein
MGRLRQVTEAVREFGWHALKGRGEALTSATTEMLPSIFSPALPAKRNKHVSDCGENQRNGGKHDYSKPADHHNTVLKWNSNFHFCELVFEGRLSRALKAFFSPRAAKLGVVHNSEFGRLGTRHQLPTGELRESTALVA